MLPRLRFLLGFVLRNVAYQSLKPSTLKMSQVCGHQHSWSLYFYNKCICKCICMLLLGLSRVHVTQTEDYYALMLEGYLLPSQRYQAASCSSYSTGMLIWTPKTREPKTLLTLVNIFTSIFQSDPVLHAPGLPVGYCVQVAQEVLYMNVSLQTPLPQVLGQVYDLPQNRLFLVVCIQLLLCCPLIICQSCF